MKNFNKRDESSYEVYSDREEYYPEEVVVEAGNDSNNDEKVVGEVTKCYQLKIRSAPSENAEVFGMIKSGSEIHILDDSDPKFYKVVTEYGLTGFVMKEFVKLKK